MGRPQVCQIYPLVLPHALEGSEVPLRPILAIRQVTSAFATTSTYPASFSASTNEGASKLISFFLIVTLVGATASAVADWSANQATILSPSIPFSINTNGVKGVTLRNINFVNSATTAATVGAVAVSLRGPNVAFYGCSFVSPGTGVITSTYGTTFIANSYVEGSDKLFNNLPSIYVYKSTIVPLSSSALIVYSKGATLNSVFYNSSVIIDSSSVERKSGYTNTNVFLAAANGVGSTVIYRNTALGSLIAATGFHPSSTSANSYYGEYLTTGSGSYGKVATPRPAYDIPLTASQVSQFTVDKVFGNAFYPYGTTDVSWVDADVQSSLQASYANANAIATAPVVSSSIASSSVASSSIASSSVATSSVASSSAATSSTASNTSSAVSSGSLYVSSSDSASVTSTISLSAVSSTSSTISSSASDVSTIDSTIASSSSISASTSATSCSAPTPSGTLVVSKAPGPCEYSNVTSAISALPNDSKPYTISIGAGTYVEQLSITRNGKVTLVGFTSFNNDYTQNQVRLEFSSGRLTNLGQNEQTPVINAKKNNDNSGLALYNIDFVNTFPQTANTAALAADFYGANIAAYGCSFVGFQDTLLANKGTQVFSNCYIEGSVDFIWGYSTAYFYQCKIVSNTPGAYITAHSRASTTAVGGYVFDSCMVTYSSTYGNIFGTTSLGRPWSQYAIAVYKNSYLDKHIKEAGWSVWSTSSPQTSDVTFGEFNNTGPGSWQSTTQRASFATNLTVAQAAKYDLIAWIGSSSWLDLTAFNYVPSFSLTGPSTTTPSTTSSITSSTSLSATSSSNSSSSATLSSAASSASASANSTASTFPTNSKVNAHPDTGTVPPAGAVIVSVDGSNNAAFTSLTSALASLPQDSTNQTVFLYPGSYNEQVPTVNRAGPVRIIGYVSGNSGQSYKDNQVTITYSRGLAIGTTGHSNAETAVVATASTRISLYNINMINTDNLDGATSNYVALAASIYGNDIAFYGCSFDGWQDTLFTGATAGYQYYESCYIGGSIDFIWGYSKAYFKGCTIGAKRASSCITAQSRASATAIGGYIFDQCLFTKAPSSTADLTNKVFLGRPYSQYALVVVKNSYLDSTISPTGWKIWSATEPRTSAIIFAEYNNAGPSNWENNAAARQAFGYATLLTTDTYSLASVMDSTEWIDLTYWDSIVTPTSAFAIGSPVSSSASVSSTATISVSSGTESATSTPTASAVSGTSVYNGTTPPSDALIVSKDPVTGVITYDTIQAALNAAPVSSSKNATIFIYPGVYEEQLIISKSGHTIFQGYSSATDNYAQNQVTIQFSRGVDTQGSTGSNTDSATVYATGNYFHAFNINFRNNLGTTQSMASLGFAVKSSKFAALYACQIYGNQDTLSVSGNLFTFKTYIEGNVDFIYGSGSAYFLASTIATNEDGISITAHKRATNTTNAGFVFDQCTVQPAAGSGTFTNVGLGRPWNNLSRVVYVNCYLNAMISAAGWNQWSKSSPQIDGVQYGEYHNYGPGAGICKRASFSSQLSDTDVVQYQLANLFATTSFINFGRIDTQPFNVGIGSAQTCATLSSSVSSSRTLSSTLSSSSILSSSVVSSSIPIVTAYTTTTSTLKLTASTTITAADVVSTTVVKITSTITETGVDVLKTSTQKITSTVSYTSPDVTSTSTFAVTKDVGSTITLDPVTKTNTVKAVTTESAVVTKAAATSTIKATSTVTAKITSTPKAVTTTLIQGSTITVTSTITPKGQTTTVATTTVLHPSTTKTVTVDLKNVVTISSTTIKMTTKKSTTTLRCVPTGDSAQRMIRRGAVIPRAAAGTTTTITSTTTYTTFVKTATSTQLGTTSTSTVTLVAATKTAILPGSTSTETITQVAKTATINYAGATVLTTTTIMSQIGKTTTLRAATTTIDSTSLVTVTTTSTITSPVVTITSYKVATSTQTEIAAQPTVTVAKSSDVTSSTKTTLPASTTTKFSTVTEGTGVATSTITAANKTKTTTVKITFVVTSWATKTSKGAAACSSA